VHLDRFLGVVADGSLTHSAMAFDIIDVRNYGAVVVVIAHGTNDGTWNGEPFSADEMVTEVIVRDGDAWRCAVSALTPRAAETWSTDV
jgi:hypothetical protein